ncbi:methyl-accepting chemotaxis protein [Paenibacillus alkalitolerans]|uniref:methyl-accepting chemotaxis protein n=1 Tax=Paenibacillus alkalitolerans TaxID=2799335 RepID=UPI0018F7A505|nr:HAMP domain-containing methyl-accepting chemotaxis protein [Paenibacillus alkalitolerans]
MLTQLRSRTHRPQLNFISLLRHTGLSVKLAAGFALVLLIFSAVAIFNHFRMEQIQAKDTYERNLATRQQLSAELKMLVFELDSVATGYMVSNKSDLVDRYDALSAKLDLLVKQVGQTAADREQREWGARLTAVSKEFMGNFERVKAIADDPSLSPIEKQESLARAYMLSQLHKQTIFDLVQKFYDAYTAADEEAKAETAKLLAETRTVTSYAAAAALIVGVALAVTLVLSLRRGISKISRSVQLLSEGDLRHTINARTKDELGLLSDSLDASVARIKHMLTETKRFAESLREQSQLFAGFARTTADSNGSIVAAMEQIAAGASKQAVQAERSSSVLREWEDRLQEIESTASVLLGTGAKANRHAKTGAVLVEQLQDASRVTVDAVKTMQQALARLEKQSSEIAGITGTIADISQRTNILALNASIESARAGEQGKGFAVIAEEVRELSVQSNQSSKRIEHILSDLRRQTADVSRLMGTAMDSLMTQNGKVEETQATFRTIFSVISDFDEQIRFINEKVNDSKEKQEHLAESVQIVASIAQQTAAGVQETAASSAEQDRSVGRVAAEAQNMNSLSEAIFKEISHFKIED